MPEALPNGDDLRALLQQLGGEGVPQAVTAGGDPRFLGIACHLLRDGLDGEGPVWALLIPEDVLTGD